MHSFKYNIYLSKWADLWLSKWIKVSNISFLFFSSCSQTLRGTWLREVEICWLFSYWWSRKWLLPGIVVGIDLPFMALITPVTDGTWASWKEREWVLSCAHQVLFWLFKEQLIVWRCRQSVHQMLSSNSLWYAHLFWHERAWVVCHASWLTEKGSHTSWTTRKRERFSLTLECNIFVFK